MTLVAGRPYNGIMILALVALAIVSLLASYGVISVVTPPPVIRTQEGYVQS